MFQKQPLEVFCKKNDLKNFAKFAEKQLSRILFFNKVAGLRPAIFKTLPMNFDKILRTPFGQNTTG